MVDGFVNILVFFFLQIAQDQGDKKILDQVFQDYGGRQHDAEGQLRFVVGFLGQMMPFGLDNDKPIFLFENVVVESLKQFGKKTDHLELVFRNTRGDKISAIGFFSKPEDFANVPAAAKKINLVASLEKSVFGGRTELRLRIVDII